MKKMKIIKNGNLIPKIRVLIWANGILITAFSYFFLDGKLMFLGVFLGIIIAMIGAYAEQANTFKLKPFDKSFKRAGATYSEEKRKEDI